MSGKRDRKFTRREFLRWGGSGALALLAGGMVALPELLRRAPRALAAADSAPVPAAPVAPVSPATATNSVYDRLVGTDGHILLPGRADPLYVFGFREVAPEDVNVPVETVIQKYKGKAVAPSSPLGVDQETDFYLTMTNLGMATRPDLDDSHTIHWHGFRNPIAVFDGVPEVSVAVPPGRDFPYFFRPHDPGTYMYHCHFEDVEHVQMGMNGVVYVRPLQNYTGAGGSVPVARLGGEPNSPVLGYAYNDGDGSTAYDREFTFMLNEIDTRPHDLLEAVQEFIWTNYKPNYWIMNGRAYPDTIKPSNDPSLPFQPISSLIQVNEGERVLLRLANLGYEQHAMQLTGIRMKVVGHDATLLRNPPKPPFGPNPVDLTYETNTIYIGPGEARDVIFVAPAYDATRKETDTAGDHNVYWFKNRNAYTQTNNGLPGLGGMVTQVRVYPSGTLPLQTAPNETYL